MPGHSVHSRHFIFKWHYYYFWFLKKVFGGKGIIFIVWPRFTSEPRVKSCRMWAEKLCVLSPVMRCRESRKWGLPVSVASSHAVTPIHNIITARVKQRGDKYGRKRVGRTPDNEDEKELWMFAVESIQ